ncbi:phosphatase PAP2 family protein [Saccharothrix sp. HUAS TT1]|uniref:phosphatase PAP2 family protein n=1 Tax=unclassified Saccharothrix TaxID=2593673 RepID=UPI00345C5249
MQLRVGGETGSGNGLYDGVVEFAGGTPEWLRVSFALFTDAGLVVLAVLLAVAWWRARGRGDLVTTVVALLAPVVTVLAYGVSEALKAVVEEERPCRGLPVGFTVAVCPEVGDWSFPSNHSAIAGAAAVGLALAWRELRGLAVVLAVLMAFSRVFVGAHYPHDVLAGLLLGAVVAWVAIRLLTDRATALAVGVGDHRLLGWVVRATPPRVGSRR